jgi:acid phosphatase
VIRRLLLPALVLLAVAPVAVVGSAAGGNPRSGEAQLRQIDHIVVIYEENHSFDNLFGSWEGVNGLNNVHPSGIGDHVTQVDQNGVAYGCLKQLDVNLTSPPLPADCTDTTHGITSHFKNTWFPIDQYIQPSDVTCPPITNAFAYSNGILKGGLDPATLAPVPGARAGGCTRDLVHEFYQEQYQLDGGRQDRYMSGSDSAGTTMGVYDTTQIALYRYLHEQHHPDYAIADNFFQAAFGGSFLNHQWLIAAATPVYPGAPANLHSLIDSNGMPTSYPLYTATGTVSRQPLTVACPTPPAAKVCGDFAVNTMQPTSNPQGAFGAILPPQTAPTIGDRLSDAGISWAWYSGGWANADGDVNDPGYTNQKTRASTPTGCSDPNVDTGVRNNVPVANWPRCPDALFQYHHQPFNYFANYAPGTPGRAHLQDEVDFMNLANSSDHTCRLDAVSFVKPVGEENEHPGYASEPNGNDHLVDDLLKPIENSACAKDTMVIVTYDEFGGQWDHVSPPGQGNDNGPHDVWGPGTRIPALVIAPHLPGGDFVVDSVEHDTTSILATIEHRFDLAPLGTRDAAVNDLSTVFTAGNQKPEKPEKPQKPEKPGKPEKGHRHGKH